MKTSAVIIFAFLVCVYLEAAHAKSLKSYYGNSIKLSKGPRKPFASPGANRIHDNSSRAKRQVSQEGYEFQNDINAAKIDCVREMKMSPNILEKSLMYEELPTGEEKCLLMCMLKKTKLMEESNKLSVGTIARIAATASENNPLVVSIAMATAQNCNASIKAEEEPCEAAYQINRCIARELKARKLKFYY